MGRPRKYKFDDDVIRDVLRRGLTVYEIAKEWGGADEKTVDRALIDFRTRMYEDDRIEEVMQCTQPKEEHFASTYLIERDHEGIEQIDNVATDGIIAADRSRKIAYPLTKT